MRGSIVKKGGAYYVVHDEYVDGKRKKVWTAAGATRAEADDKLTEVLGAVKRGAYVDSSRTTLADYLTKTWLPAARATVKASTAELYAVCIDAYIVPHIGPTRLQDLRGAHLNRLYATLATSGKRDGSPLAAKSIRNVHTLLHRALKDAIRWDLVVRNTAEAADPPKVARPAAAHWNAPQIAAFLIATADDRLGPLWFVLATTGARRGEALALRWPDLELGEGRMAIARSLAWVVGKATFGEPKTARSRRSVPLPAETVAVLRDLRKRQAAEQLAAGPLWTDNGLVFADELGAPCRPANVTRAFGRAVDATGLPRLTLPGLRHTWATVALGAGVLTKVVSEQLGHSSIAVTGDIYSHVTEPSTRAASEQVAAAMFGRSR